VRRDTLKAVADQGYTASTSIRGCTKAWTLSRDGATSLTFYSEDALRQWLGLPAKRRRQTTRQTEHRFRATVTAFLGKLSSIWSVKIHGGAFQRAGVPDYLLCVNKFLIGLELKRGNRGLTKTQVREAKKIRNAGGVVYVASTMKDIRSILHHHGVEGMDQPLLNSVEHLEVT